MELVIALFAGIFSGAWWAQDTVLDGLLQLFLRSVSLGLALTFCIKTPFF